MILNQLTTINFYATMLIAFLFGNSSLNGQELRFFSFNDWNSADFKSWVPQEFNLARYNTLIIAEILDERNRESSETQNIYDKLSNEIFGIQGINLLDRGVTHKLLEELEFQSSGLVDAQFIQKLGQFYSSGVLLVGRIQNNDFKSEILSSKFRYDSSCGRLKFRKAILELSFSFKLIDLTTTEVIYSNVINISETEETKQTCSPPKISKIALYNKSLSQLGGRFKKLFTGHQVFFKVRFQKHRKFNDRLKQAITYMRVGDMEKGYNLLKSIANNQTNTKALSCALYNLAAFELQTSRESKAFQNAKQAYLLNSKNEASLKIVKLFN